jgi:hypothetical protein
MIFVFPDFLASSFSCLLYSQKTIPGALWEGVLRKNKKIGLKVAAFWYFSNVTFFAQ